MEVFRAPPNQIDNSVTRSGTGLGLAFGLQKGLLRHMVAKYGLDETKRLDAALVFLSL